MTHLPPIASQFYGCPLLLHPDAAALMAQGPGEGLDVGLLRGEPAQNGGRYTVVNGKAVIPISGGLSNRNGWAGYRSSLSSYDGIAEQVGMAVEDPAVSAIVLDVNTPGGQAVGAFECAAEIRAADAKKPVTAMVNGMAASAGYALASAARRIVVTPSSMVGSIGVVLLHLDHTRALDRMGVKPTLIFAGDNKVDLSPLSTMSDSVKASLQAHVDKTYAMFVGTVARHRGMKADAVKATQARCYMGADAVAIGLADAVGKLADVLSSAPTPRSGGALLPAPPPSPPAPRPRTAAERRALQVEACAEVWRNSGRAKAASMGFPADVMEQVGATMQEAAHATWDAVLTDYRGPRDAA